MPLQLQLPKLPTLLMQRLNERDQRERQSLLALIQFWSTKEILQTEVVLQVRKYTY
jgi:hypothetical protein